MPFRSRRTAGSGGARGRPRGSLALAHVLIGWELGSASGHANRMVQVAARLKAQGHKVSFAAQRIDALSPEAAAGSAVWPAPVTPRLLINSAPSKGASPNTMGDIMARLGCDDAGLVAAIVRGWHRLLAAIEPDLAVAEFAPFMLLAARGRVPTVATATGFGAPPSAMPHFPSLTGQPASVDEAATLDSVNAALRTTGTPMLAALPELFAADRELAGTYAELDSYHRWRVQPLVMPSLPEPQPPIAGGEGAEVFVYAPEWLGEDAALWRGLAASRLPVRVHAPRMSQRYRQALGALGFAVEAQPVPFPVIAERSRLLVSHGGHGFVCSALLSGLPQVVCHYDLEKLVNGQAVARLGVGGLVPMMQIEPNAFAESLVRLYQDDALFGRAQAAAPGFHARYDRTMQQSAADAVEAVLQGKGLERVKGIEPSS